MESIEIAEKIVILEHECDAILSEFPELNPSPGGLEGLNPLDSLCQDLERVASEKSEELPGDLPEAVLHQFHQVELQYEEMQETVMCCRMLGEVNGRAGFSPVGGLQWGKDGKLSRACQ